MQIELWFDYKSLSYGPREKANGGGGIVGEAAAKSAIPNDDDVCHTLSLSVSLCLSLTLTH